MSLRPKGTPWSGPRARPALRARSAARAARRASSARTRTKLLSRRSCAAMRASEASTRALAVTRPATRARLAAAAVGSAVAGSARMVGPEDEIDLVLIAEAPGDQRDELAHRRLGLFRLFARNRIEMIERNKRRIGSRCHVGDPFNERSRGGAATRRAARRLHPRSRRTGR